MQQRNLAQWLAWMESHHPRQIELGLDRVAAVAKNLTLDLSGAKIITVGGTNGKGSCVAFLDAILRAQDYRVGAYTSPHLLRYNERVRIDGVLVDDAALSEAFAHVHAALFGISLTYFEFGTLAALWLFQQARLDVIVLEVGLGGRLDAVNLVDPDVAVLTTIDLDHQDWLGP
jgi:dihydrofolate synthase/folylpolyglutamate synthase